ncbi:PREDICTED: protein WALLS ARE THIN 1-like [Lupinus angustifolius]|uniref:protein WALLS ARE THIN 1-like n=1 Tax=Lupinus angustifolius TaxID=3871 RepID=UPI00092F6687|nr:PREDICTED: protein WALLS ARE THIN 1-like [Lupinus angustifolius]
MSDSSRRMWCFVPERFQLHVAMLLTQFCFAGFHVLSRNALNMGVNKFVFPVYRNLIALVLLLPFAYFLEKKERPAITLNFLGQFFLLALVGVTANQGLYLLGLENTSPTFVSAIQNSVPAITFLMAVILRIEQVKLKRKDGVAKVAGTIFCVAGATVITFYKGPTIYSPTKPLLNSIITTITTPQVFDFGSVSVGDAKEKNWILGCFYLIGHCLSWAGWLVFQTPLLKKFPARLSVTSYTFFFGLLQFLLIALIFERDAKAWVFHSAQEALTILYGGVVISGIAFTVQIWCIDRSGPVFVAMFQPVQTFVVALFASLALGEEFHLGGLIGAVLVVVGLYLVLRGRSEEKKFAMKQLAIAERSILRPASHDKSSLTQPLLPSSTQNV